MGEWISVSGRLSGRGGYGVGTQQTDLAGLRKPAKGAGTLAGLTVRVLRVRG
jgi:hypothetical protein